jgi:hypothetical protein
MDLKSELMLEYLMDLKILLGQKSLARKIWKTLIATCVSVRQYHSSLGRRHYFPIHCCVEDEYVLQ